LTTSRVQYSTRYTNAGLGNIAFFIRHNQSSYGKQIDPGDISIASRNWKGNGDGSAGIGVFVVGSGYTHTVFRVKVNKDDSAIDKLVQEVNGHMEKFFPGI
jgi:hypothetical protein